MNTFNYENIYLCECGKKFYNSQSFNGHKGHCKIHMLAKYGNTIKLDERRTNLIDQCNKNRENKKLELIEVNKSKIQEWISEQHTCEKCGKVMTEKFGSGRFCSRSCANSRERSEEVKEKIRKSVIESDYNIEIKKSKKVSFCKECGKLIGNYTKTGLCSYCLYHTDYGKSIKVKTPGGYRKGSGLGKHGWYKGYYCDSSWELAYVIYNLEHNIPFIRNKQGFEYTFKDETLKYFPDFIEDGKYVEIKGYSSDKWKAKIEQFKYPIKVITYTEIKPYLDYVIEKYGKDFIQLYE